MKSALAKYKHIINTNIPNKENNININTVSLPKFYYHSLIQEIFKKPISENKWLQQFGLNTYDFTSTYITKIKKIRDKKIAEFNYKLIHRIIPCKYKLQKWGLTNNNACSLCGQIETVEHMLFLCENVKDIWKIFLNKNKCPHEIKFLILGDKQVKLQWAISIITQFIIFKNWVFKQNKKENGRILTSRCRIYQINGYDEVVDTLKSLNTYL